MFHTREVIQPCSITKHEDHDALVSFNHHLGAPQLTTTCQDETFNMTCSPIYLMPVHYICVCVARKGDFNTAIKWSDEWDEITEPFTAMRRTLCDTEAGWCIDGMVKKGLVYLVKRYAPLDSQITVSSTHTIHTKEQARIQSVGTLCAWISKPWDDNPQRSKFDPLQSYIGVGVLMRKRCDNPSYFVTSSNVSTSSDDVCWSHVYTDVQAVYQGISLTWWFQRKVSARYWRISPVTYNNYAALQVDIIGYI